MNGDLANWSTGKGIPAVGGAMDLVAGAKNVFVMTQHLTKEGKPKLVENAMDVKVSNGLKISQKALDYLNSGKVVYYD